MKRLILGIGILIGFTIICKADGIKHMYSPGRISSDFLMTGTNSEFRNASYKVFMSTVSGGTEYVTFTPSSATFRQGLYVGSGNGLFISNAAGSTPGFFTFTTPGNTPTITTENNGITLASQGGGAGESIKLNTNNTPTFAVWGSGGLSHGRTSIGIDPGLDNFNLDGNISLISGGSISSTANGDITFTPNGTGNVNWTSPNSTMTTAGTLTLGTSLVVSGHTIGSNGNMLLTPSGTTSVTANGNFSVGGNGLADFTGNIIAGDAITDDIRFVGLPSMPSNANPRANSIVPVRAGAMIWNSTLLSACVSSGTVATSWVRIEAPTTACQ